MRSRASYTRVALAVVMLLAAPARADRTAGPLFAASGGMVVPFGPRATDSTRAVVALPMTLPALGLASVDGLRRANADELSRRISHLRALLVPELLLGERRGLDPEEVAHVGFRLHPVVYLVAPATRRLDVLGGLGSTIDFWPSVRPSLATELGVRFRTHECEHGFSICYFRYASIVVRGDAFPSGPDPAELTTLVGVSGL